MDIVRVALVVNVIAVGIALGTGSVVAWQNAGSRNLALATGAVAAAMVLYLIQLPFELRRSVSYDHVSTELTIDRSKPSIRQWKYGDNSAWRIHAETRASSWLTQNNRQAFEQDRAKLTTDLVLFSLVSFLAAEEHDWQLRKVTYTSKSTGSLTTIEPVSKSEECSLVTNMDLQSLLSQAGNLFANAPIFPIPKRGLCLPPGTKIDISANSLVMKNPIYQFSWTIKHPGAVNHMQPGTGDATPQLPSGGSQFETRFIGLNVETTYFALRAHHRDSGKYREWCSRLISDAREWFQS